METVKVTLTGQGAMLMHSDKLCDPLNKATIAYNDLKKDRKLKATTEGKIQIAKIMYINSFYLNSDNKIILPMFNIRKSLIEGARRFKLGMDVQRSVLFYEDPVVNYGSNMTPEQMWKDYGEFVDARPVVIGRAKVMAYRPKFDNWTVTFSCQYDPTVIDPTQLKECWDIAGSMMGIGDFRPLFGRYTVEIG